MPRSRPPTRPTASGARGRRGARSPDCRSRSRTCCTSKAGRRPPGRRAGAAAFPITRPPRSTRLIAAGMIPLGKTHMVEFAFGGWGRNRPMGAPWNPWDTKTHRVAGGSSSGSAVAVAGGLVSGGDRLRHRRLDPHSGGALRHHRLEAHVWPCEPVRRGAAVRHARLDRPARAHRRRCGAADRGDGGTRPARSRDAARAPRRSRGRRRRRARRARPAHHGARAGDVSRVHAARRGPRVRGRDRHAARAGRARGRGRVPARLRRHDGAERPDHRGRGVRAASRLHRGSVARHRSVGEAARAGRQGDQRRRLSRSPGAAPPRRRERSRTGCAIATRC